MCNIVNTKGKGVLLLITKVYTITCDLCSKSEELDDANSVPDARNKAQHKAWIVSKKDFHLCPNCKRQIVQEVMQEEEKQEVINT